jgi:hypothetical protein
MHQLLRQLCYRISCECGQSISNVFCRFFSLGNVKSFVASGPYVGDVDKDQQDEEDAGEWDLTREQIVALRTNFSPLVSSPT